MSYDNRNMADLWKRAYYFSIFTIFFNIIEGLVSVYFGAIDDALTLFGFGIDSFIETISAVGVLVMIQRIRRNPDREKTNFEVTALIITGWCFYALSVILAAGIVMNLVNGTKPASSLPGVIISLISIAFMLWLIYSKKSIGMKLSCAPIIADANCTLVCVYMSIVLLLSSAAYEIFGFGWIDVLGTAGIIYFSVKEGIESFHKAREMKDAE
jgi:divalent metal cation (Fe/Co/Zn/Cd) transporter